MANIAIRNGNWVIQKTDDKSSEIYHVFNHVVTNVTKFFQNVANLINDMRTVLGSDFDDWFDSLIKEYIDSKYNSEIIKDNSMKILEFAEKYVKAKNIDISRYVDYSKKSSTSVLFDEKDIESILISSTALKIYSVFWYDNTLRLPDNIHRMVYKDLVKPCIDNGTTTKVYQIIRSRTCRSSITDRYMWDIIKISLIETPEHYTMHVFNYFMNNLFAALNLDTNPISYIVGIIDESIGWMLTTVYNNKIIYGEMFSDTEEIYGTSLHQNLVHIKCCNDTLGKVAKASMELVERQYNLSEEDFRKFRERLDFNTIIHPHLKRLTIPIISKVLGIPYSYLIKTPPSHLTLASIMMYECSKDILETRFPILREYLICSPIENIVVSSKSSYRLKNIEFIINDNMNRFFGFRDVYTRYRVMSSVCGVLSASKKNMEYVIDGQEMPRFNYKQLESEVCTFFGEFYSEKLDSSFDKMSERVDQYI